MIYLPRWMRLIMFYITSAMAVMMGLMIVWAIYSIGVERMDKGQSPVPILLWISVL